MATPSMGLPALREAVASDIEQRYGIEPDINLGRSFLGETCYIYNDDATGRSRTRNSDSRPGFPIYQSAINYSGARSVSYGLVEKNGFAFDAEDVLSKITDKTSLAIKFTGKSDRWGNAPSRIGQICKRAGSFSACHCPIR